MAGINAVPSKASLGSATMQVLKNSKGSIAFGAGAAAIFDTEMQNDFKNGNYVSGTARLTTDVATTVVADKALKYVGKKTAPITNPIKTFISEKLGGNALKKAVKGVGEKVIKPVGKVIINTVKGPGGKLLLNTGLKATSTLLLGAGKMFRGKGGLIGAAATIVLVGGGVALGVLAEKGKEKTANNTTATQAPPTVKTTVPATESSETADNSAESTPEPVTTEPAASEDKKTAVIDGNDGQYGPVQTDKEGNLDYENSVKYGQNAISNWGKNKSDEYEYNYLPIGHASDDNLKTALIAEAKGELGGESKTIEQLKNQGWAHPEALDFTGSNGEKPDGIITAAELAASNLFVDALGSPEGELDGKFTNTDIDKYWSIRNENSNDDLRAVFKEIYDGFGLEQIENSFKKNETKIAETNPPVEESKEEEPTNQISDRGTNKGNSETQQAVAAEQPKATAPAPVQTEDSKTLKLEKGKTLGDLVVANKKELAEKYGTSQLWGEGGLVDRFAKENGYTGVQDEKLQHLDVGKGFKINA